VSHITNPLHLSYSPSHLDGGIAFAVSDLLHSQQKSGMFARWLTADKYQSWNRDRNLLNSIKSSQANIIHSHGLWRSHTRITLQLTQINLPVMIAPHGMLDSWAITHSFWKKKVALALWEKQALESANCLQALCLEEAFSIKNVCPRAKVALIPNGVNLPPEDSEFSCLKLPWKNDIPAGQKILLFLGRFHHKKGLEPLMAAWISVVEEAKKKGWWLVLIGYGDDGKFVSQLTTFPIENCKAYGPVFGDDKEAVFHYATAFILPSFSEGLPMAALEAMSHYNPCLLSRACNIPSAFTCGAALKAEPDPLQLSIALRKLFSLSEHQHKQMSLASYNLVKDRFSWEKVTSLCTEVYLWMLDRSRPMPTAFNWTKDLSN